MQIVISQPTLARGLTVLHESRYSPNGLSRLSKTYTQRVRPLMKTIFY
jgi:hypothetical protein